MAVFKETASGADNKRPRAAKVLGLARRREIGAILVTEHSRCVEIHGRPSLDARRAPRSGRECVGATGLNFDLATPSGKLLRTLMAGLAEFERDLIRERVKSGLAAARARGAKLGRQVGQRPSDKKVSKVLDLRREGLSYRIIARDLGMSPTTVMEIVRRGLNSDNGLEVGGWSTLRVARCGNRFAARTTGTKVRDWPLLHRPPSAPINRYCSFALTHC